jgi:hypothetical protein
MRLEIRPTTLKAANNFVSEYHRHNGRTARDGGRFALAAEAGGTVVGVAIVGNPVSATYMDGRTAEILRVCTSPDAPKNTNSFLFGAARRVWFAMGGSRIFTYTLKEESGASLRASGWSLDGETVPHAASTWGKKDHLSDRRQTQAIYTLKKNRWVSIRSEPTERERLEENASVSNGESLVRSQSPALSASVE